MMRAEPFHNDDTCDEEFRKELDTILAQRGELPQDLRNLPPRMR